MMVFIRVYILRVLKIINQNYTQSLAIDFVQPENNKKEELQCCILWRNLQGECLTARFTSEKQHIYLRKATHFPQESDTFTSESDTFPSESDTFPSGKPLIFRSLVRQIVQVLSDKT